MLQSRNIRWIISLVIVVIFLRDQTRLLSCDLSFTGDASGANNNNNVTVEIRSMKTIQPLIAKNETKPACGVFFFFHTPSTGGASINKWLWTQHKLYNYTYFTAWEIAVNKAGVFHASPKAVEQKFIKGMNELVENIGPNEWRISHSHILSSYLNESDFEMDYWRARVESQGCKMVNSIMLRDPLNHAMSLYKIYATKGGQTREQWIEHLKTPSAAGMWATQLDFFLYDIRAQRNPYGVSKEEKVRRGLEILDRHFDVIAVSDHNFYFDETLRQTGWKYESKIPRTNVHHGQISFTKEEVETLQKLLDQNGDTDFYNSVKMRYKGHLSYLLGGEEIST